MTQPKPNKQSSGTYVTITCRAFTNGPIAEYEFWTDERGCIRVWDSVGLLWTTCHIVTKEILELGKK